jgi:putative tricarboxylic transport membrane protein
VIFVCCVVGAYALSNRMYDVWVVIGFGVLGFFLERARVPLGPFVIGFVLEGIFEAELRSSLQMSDRGFLGILDRPIALTFLALSLIMLLWPFVQALRRRAATGAAEKEAS